ncbi:hypothetical protein ABPG77_005893 [Micractinium sp. CCAP 211/92]
MTALLSASVSVCSAARSPSVLRAVQSSRCSFSPSARLPSRESSQLRSSSSSRPVLVVAGGDEAGPASSKPPQLASLVRELSQPLSRSLLSLGSFLCLWQWVRFPAAKAAPLAALVLAALLLPAAIRRAAQNDRVIVRLLCRTQSPAAVVAKLHHESAMLRIHSELVACFVAAAHVLVFTLLVTAPQLLALGAAQLAGPAEASGTAMVLLGLLFYKAWRAWRLFWVAEEVCRQASAEGHSSGRSSGGQQP